MQSATRDQIAGYLNQALLILGFSDEELLTFNESTFDGLTEDIVEGVIDPTGSPKRAKASADYLAGRGRDEQHGEKLRINRAVGAFFFGMRAGLELAPEVPEVSAPEDAPPPPTRAKPPKRAKPPTAPPTEAPPDETPPATRRPRRPRALKDVAERAGS